MPVFRTRLSENHLVQVRWETARRGRALVASLILSPAYSLQNHARGQKDSWGVPYPDWVDTIYNNCQPGLSGRRFSPLPDFQGGLHMGDAQQRIRVD